MTAFFITVLVALGVLGLAMGNSATTTVQVKVNPASAPNVSPTPKPSGGNFNYVSDGSLTGMLITNVPSTWPGAGNSLDYPNEKLWNVCTAVALAEGYNQGVGTAPYDLNNPGDLSPGDEAGQEVSGPPQTHGGSSIICFATVEGGFIALYTKFDRIVSGKSSVYAVTDTWSQVAEKYAGNSAAWLANVTNYLGVDPQSVPVDYANS